MSALTLAIFDRMFDNTSTMSPNSLFSYPTREHLKTPNGPVDHIYVELRYGGRGERLRGNLHQDLHNIYGGTELAMSLAVFSDAYSRKLAEIGVSTGDLSAYQETEVNEKSFYTGALLGVRVHTMDLSRADRARALQASSSHITFDNEDGIPTVAGGDLATWSTRANDLFQVMDASVVHAVNRLTSYAYEDFDPIRRGVHISLFASGFAYGSDQVGQILGTKEM